MLKLTAKLIGLYKSNDYTNKDTGEVQTGKTKLQLQTTRKMQDDSEKIELHDISIPSDKTALYKNKVGQDVEVPVAYIGKVTFYGV